MDRSESPLTYAYSSRLPCARLTRLSIEGLGKINLPLSETDAKRMVAFASPARFAQAKQTIGNREVQKTWKFDTARVKFDDPQWHGCVQRLAAGTVCTMLGAKYDTPPRCELYKLLVYETGSR